MDLLLAFLIAIVLAGLLIPRLGPFLGLVISAVVYGLLSGMGQELMGYVATGLGRIFSSLAVVVFCGAIIAEYLRRTGAIERIVSDLLRLSRRGMLVSGLAGYLISLPVMCSITAYMILEPIVSSLGTQTEGDSRRFLLMTAASSVVSFNLIYPSPVTVSLSGSLGLQPIDMLKVGLPISLLLLIIAYAYMLRLPAGEGKRTEGTPPEISRTRAWAPLLLPIFLVLLGALGQARLLGNPSVALLLGSLLCLAMARSRIEEMVSTASRRSGVILLDLCGAGAFGYVVAQSGLGQALYGSLGKAVPLLLLPFLISSLLQLAQGSRVVTVVIAAQMLRDYPLDGITLSLLICAGAFMLSYVSDPYFWLVRESTGSSMREMLLGYTLPLSLLGMAAFVYAIIYNIMII